MIVMIGIETFELALKLVLLLLLAPFEHSSLTGSLSVFWWEVLS